MTYEPDAIMLVRYGTDGTERIVKDATVPTIVPVGNCPGVPHRGHTDARMVCPSNVRVTITEDEGGTHVMTEMDGYLPPGEVMNLDTPIFGDAVPASADQIERAEEDPEPTHALHMHPSMGEAYEAAVEHERISMHHTVAWMHNTVDGGQPMWQCSSCDGNHYTPTVGDWGRLKTAERQRDILGDELRAMRISEQADKVRITGLERELSAVTADYEKYRRESRKMMAEHDKAVAALRIAEQNLDLALTANEEYQRKQEDYRMRTAAHEAALDRATTELDERITELGELRAQMDRVPENGFILGGTIVAGKQCPIRLAPHWPHLWGPPGTAVWHKDHARYCAGVRGLPV